MDGLMEFTWKLEVQIKNVKFQEFIGDRGPVIILSIA